MILLVGRISDENKRAVFNESVFVWIEPERGLDLFDLNEFGNELTNLSDAKNLIIWTNSGELINRFHEGQIWRVNCGIINKFSIKEVLISNESFSLSEIVTRNWL